MKNEPQRYYLVAGIQLLVTMALLQSCSDIKQERSSVGDGLQKYSDVRLKVVVNSDPSVELSGFCTPVITYSLEPIEASSGREHVVHDEDYGEKSVMAGRCSWSYEIDSLPIGDWKISVTSVNLSQSCTVKLSDTSLSNVVIFTAGQSSCWLNYRPV